MAKGSRRFRNLVVLLAVCLTLSVARVTQQRQRHHHYHHHPTVSTVYVVRVVVGRLPDGPILE